MKTKNKYSEINSLVTLLNIDPIKLESKLQNLDTKNTWETFRKLIIKDLQYLVSGFEHIEWKTEIDKLAEKKYNEIIAKIQNARIDNQKECIIEFPYDEIKPWKKKGDIKLTNRSVGWYLHGYPPTESITQLNNLLSNRYPNQTIGTWIRVVERLLKEKYIITLNKEWEGRLKGILTIVW